MKKLMTCPGCFQDKKINSNSGSEKNKKKEQRRKGKIKNARKKYYEYVHNNVYICIVAFTVHLHNNSWRNLFSFFASFSLLSSHNPP